MDCLPEIVMPPEPEPEPNIQMNIEEEDHHSDINANGTKAEREAEEEEPSPPRRLMEQVDIFSDAPKVKQVKEKAPKKKRVLSEEHKQKLALARQKALEVRRANSSAKKEMKEVTKLKKQQELDRLREETGTKKPTQHNQKKVVDTPIAVEPSPPSMAPKQQSQPVSIPKQQSQPVGYSQADLDKASLNAIIGYEKIRKKRKETKKNEQKAHVEQEALKKQLREITTKQKPTYETNPWSEFF